MIIMTSGIWKRVPVFFDTKGSVTDTKGSVTFAPSLVLYIFIEVFKIN